MDNFQVQSLCIESDEKQSPCDLTGRQFHLKHHESSSQANRNSDLVKEYFKWGAGKGHQIMKSI